MLDVHSLSITTLVALSLASGGTLINWYLNRNAPGVFDWAVAIIIIFSASLVLYSASVPGSVTGGITDSISGGVGSAAWAAILMGQSAIVFGLRHYRLGDRISMQVPVLGLIFVAGLFVHYSAETVEDHLLRASLWSFAGGLAACYQLYHLRTRFFETAIVGLVVWGAHAFIMVLWAVLLVSGQTDFKLWGVQWQAYALIEIQAFYFVLAMAFVSLANEWLQEQIRTLARRDPLTKLFNRRAFEELAAQAIAHARRHGENLAVLVMDLDRFKVVNDTYGHQAGDAVLVHFAQVVDRELRVTDIVARYGGEEFIVLLKDSNSETTGEVANRILKAWRQAETDFKGERIKNTVSIGATVTKDLDIAFDELVKKADQALYHAKKSGRDKLTIG